MTIRATTEGMLRPKVVRAARPRRTRRTRWAKSDSAAAKVFNAMADSERMPAEIAESSGLLAVTDSGAIEQWVDEAIAANPQAVEDVRAGGKKQKKAFGFLTGRVMQQSRGAANPPEVQRILREKLGG